MSRRGQRGEQRRQELMRILRTAHEPILASELARQFGVSRQVVVQDTVLLRAAGADIVATSRGYLLRNPAPDAQREVLHVHHDRAAIEDEMNVLVDLGIRILDVAVDHPVYGRLRADLHIASRQDVREYVEQLEKTGSAPLSALTGGKHKLTVVAPRPDLLDRAREELRHRGYLGTS
jgi:transcriptional regulator of NAD metabolism